ncbi:MAG: hypothetical protein AAB664_00910, partial [Patescibacteria group bacterium]
MKKYIPSTKEFVRYFGIGILIFLALAVFPLLNKFVHALVVMTGVSFLGSDPETYRDIDAL